MRGPARLLRSRPLFLALAALAVVIVGGGGLAAWLTARDKDVRARPRPEIDVAVNTTWEPLAIEPRALSSAAKRAKAEGQEGVAGALLFYSDSERVFRDVRFAVTAERFLGVLVVRRQAGTDESLTDLARRHLGEARGEGGRLTAQRSTLDGKPAWRFDIGTGVRQFRQVEYWLDVRSGRYSVEVSGAPGAVRELTAAVRIR